MRQKEAAPSPDPPRGAGLTRVRPSAGPFPKVPLHDRMVRSDEAQMAAVSKRRVGRAMPAVTSSGSTTRPFC
jgi:hypothetical protein